jgi:hypothetical protein
VASVAIAHLIPFLSGYRLSADDVGFHWYTMMGLNESWNFIKWAAFNQGRIVHFPDLITSLIGAKLADNIIFRTFYVSFFFANFGLFASYLNKICKLTVGWYFFLILAVFHPLDYFHLSPGAYPFKISFPVFLILVSRIAIQNMRAMKPISAWKEAPWAVLCFFGMMFSEYAFSFAFSLMLIEFALRILEDRKRDSRNWLVSVIYGFKTRQTIQDIIAIASFLLLYIGFRLIFPSSYDGNKLPEKFNFPLFAKTMIGHILGGTTFSAFSRHPLADFLSLKFNWRDYLSLILLSGGTFFSSCILLKEKLKSTQLNNLIMNLIYAAIFSFGVAFIVTAPVAVTTKYQSWCVEIKSCIFLDSSLSYLGSGVFLASMLLICGVVLIKVTKHAVVLLSLTVSLFAAAGQMNNLRMKTSMTEYVQGWEKAKELACDPNFNLSTVTDLDRIVEPKQRISFHPGSDISSYWRLVIAENKKQNGCSN